MRMGIQTLRPLALSAIMFTMLVTGGVLSPWAATAATYYVATTGHDANPGTEAQPFRTIAKGIAQLFAGDTLYLRGGTYVELIDSNNQAIPSGTSWTNAITIASYPNETATLHPSSGGAVIHLNGNYSYIIFDRLVVDAENTKNGVAFSGSVVNHLRLQNGTVKNAKWCKDPPACTQPGGQGISGLGTWSELINMKVHDNGHNRFDHGIYFCSPNSVIRDSEFYNNSGYGIHLYDPGAPGCGNNVRIYNNRVYGNRGDGGVVLSYGSNILFANNLVYDNVSNALQLYTSTNNIMAYNNTFYSNGGSAIIINSSSATNHIIRNNIFYQNGGTINNQGMATVMSNNLTTNPQFTNAATNDFTLQATSPAIDAGVTVSAVTTDFAGISRPRGAGHDIGAYEYQGIQLALPSPKNLKEVSP